MCKLLDFRHSRSEHNRAKSINKGTTFKRHRMTCIEDSDMMTPRTDAANKWKSVVKCATYEHGTTAA